MTPRAMVLLLAALGALAGACDSTESSPAGRGGGSKNRPMPVRVVEVVQSTVQGSLELVGELRAPESVEISAETAGRLRAVEAAMGDRVDEGALLAVVDASEARAQLAESRAAVEVSRASVGRAEADLRSAEAELGRKAPLAEDDLITRQEMDDVRSRRDTAAASVKVAEAQAVQARARINVLAQQLAEARIKAPFAGWVEARHLDPGAVVSPGAKILRLVRTDPMVVRFQVSERHVGLVRQTLSGGGAEVVVEVPAYRGETFDGRLARLSPAIDPESRAAWAEAEIPNADGRLMPGMYCRLEVRLGGERQALVVPAKAITKVRREGAARDLGALQVFVVGDDGMAKARAVVVGVEQGGRAEIVSGLAAGDRVVVEGQGRLRAGAKVKVLGREGSRRRDDAGPGGKAPEAR